MATVWLTQEHRDGYNPVGVFVWQLKQTHESVVATAAKPRLQEHATEARARVRELFSAYLNSLLIRFAAPGEEVYACDVLDVHNLLPVIMVWQYSYFAKWNENKSHIGNPTQPVPNAETLVWLLGYVWGRVWPMQGGRVGQRLPKLTEEAQGKIMRTTWTDAEVDEMRERKRI